MRYNNNKKSFTLIQLMLIIVILFILPAVFGWVKNVKKLAECDFKSPYKLEVIRTIGLVPPIGAIVGWIDLEKTNK